MQIQMLDYSWQKTHMHLLIASCLSKFWIFAQPWQCWSMKCALFAASVGKTSSKLLTARSPVSNGDKCSLTWRKKHFFTSQFMHFLTMRARDCGENEVQSCFWRGILDSRWWLVMQSAASWRIMLIFMDWNQFGKGISQMNIGWRTIKTLLITKTCRKIFLIQ